MVLPRIFTNRQDDLLPVLLLHGLPSHSYSWRKIMPALAARYKTIALTGLVLASPQNQSGENLLTHQMPLLPLWLSLSKLEIEQFSLVVQGFLGSVGLQYALRHSDQIESLAILNTPISTAAKLPWKMQQWTAFSG